MTQSGDRVVVTGASGFIGRHLCATLEAQGYVVTTWASISGSERSHQVIDLANLADVGDALDAVSPGAVVHLAARHPRPNRSLLDYLSEDVRVAAVMGQACGERRIDRVVFLGSAAEYAPSQAPIPPDHPVLPRSPYGMSKHLAGQALRFFERIGGSPTIILRPFNVYGPGQPPTMLLAQVAHALRTGTRMRISSPEAVRDFVHVADVSAAIVAALRTPEAAGETLNVGTGVGTAVRDIADYAAALGVDIEVTERTGIRKDTLVADIGRTTEVLSWQPTISVGDGLRGLLTGETGPGSITPGPDRTS